MEPFFSQVAIKIHLATEAAQNMLRDVYSRLVSRADMLKFTTMKTNVNRPGLNSSKLGNCKLCRKLGGKEQIYRRNLYYSPVLILFCSDWQE